ncbi:MAG TPA: DUF2231 domain-containing protein [Sphingomicrobium sp.]
MASRPQPTHRIGLHPVHAVLLASTLPLFVGALLSDLAYRESYQIQWTNFASWLVVGGLLFTGLSLFWAVVDLVRAGGRLQRSALLYPLLVLATFLAGFVNALIHAKDAWATMPGAVIFSIIVALLAMAAVWAGFSISRAGDMR